VVAEVTLDDIVNETGEWVDEDWHARLEGWDKHNLLGAYHALTGYNARTNAQWEQRDYALFMLQGEILRRMTR
jgi:hypothetical protein